MNEPCCWRPKGGSPGSMQTGVERQTTTSVRDSAVREHPSERRCATRGHRDGELLSWTRQLYSWTRQLFSWTRLESLASARQRCAGQRILTCACSAPDGGGPSGGLCCGTTRPHVPTAQRETGAPTTHNQTAPRPRTRSPRTPSPRAPSPRKMRQRTPRPGRLHRNRDRAMRGRTFERDDTELRPRDLTRNAIPERLLRSLVVVSTVAYTHQILLGCVSARVRELYRSRASHAQWETGPPIAHVERRAPRRIPISHDERGAL